MYMFSVGDNSFIFKSHRILRGGLLKDFNLVYLILRNKNLTWVRNAKSFRGRYMSCLRTNL